MTVLHEGALIHLEVRLLTAIDPESTSVGNHLDFVSVCKVNVWNLGTTLIHVNSFFFSPHKNGNRRQRGGDEGDYDVFCHS